MLFAKRMITSVVEFAISVEVAESLFEAIVCACTRI